MHLSFGRAGNNYKQNLEICVGFSCGINYVIIIELVQCNGNNGIYCTRRFADCCLAMCGNGWIVVFIVFWHVSVK